MSEEMKKMAFVIRNPQTQPVTGRDVVERLMDATLGNPWWPSFWSASGNAANSSQTFPVDIYESSESYVVLAALPGVNADEVQITALNGTLTITAEIKPTLGEGYAPLYREMTFGQFRRDVRLPGDFALDKAEATYEAGLLKLSLPKAEHLKPKSLRIKVTK